MEVLQILGHNLILEEDAGIFSNKLYFCSICDICIYTLGTELIELSSSSIRKRLTITCDEMIVKNILE